MRRQVTALLCCVLPLFAVSSSRSAPQEPAQQPFYASVKELMDAIIDPSADTIWAAVGTVVDKDQGVIEMAPKTDSDWRDVRNAALRIVEGANLLAIPTRLAAPPGSKSETPGVELEPAEITALIRNNRLAFDSFAQALQAIALETLHASDARNTAQLLDAGSRMQDVCESCHRMFWYPNEKVP